MSIYKLTYLLAVLLLVVACRRTELPPPLEENPVFAVEATLDGRPFQLEAGVADYYLFTEFRNDELDVLSFVGRWEKTSDCSEDCAEQLEIEIRNVEAGLGPLPLDIDRLLALSQRDFHRDSVDQTVDTSLAGFEVSFENLSSATVPLSYRWDFGDGQISNEPIPSPYFYPVSFLDNPPIVSLAINNAINLPTGCNEVKTQVILLDSGGGGLECTVRLNYDLTDSTKVLVCADPSGIPPFSFTWSNVDSILVDSCAFVTIEDTLLSRVEVVDATGCVSMAAFSGRVSGSGPGSTIILCNANFDYSITSGDTVEVTPIVDTLQLGTVILRYTNPDGVLYTTEGLVTPDQGQFEILESADYLDNDNGEATR